MLPRKTPSPRSTRLRPLGASHRIRPWGMAFYPAMATVRTKLDALEFMVLWKGRWRFECARMQANESGGGVFRIDCARYWLGTTNGTCSADRNRARLAIG